MRKSLFNEVADQKICNFIKKTLQHSCFLVNIAKFLTTAFLWNTSCGYLDCFQENPRIIGLLSLLEPNCL